MDIFLNKIVSQYQENIFQHFIHYTRSSVAWWLFKIHETNSYNVLLVLYFIIISISLCNRIEHSIHILGNYFTLVSTLLIIWLNTLFPIAYLNTNHHIVNKINFDYSIKNNPNPPRSNLWK